MKRVGTWVLLVGLLIAGCSERQGFDQTTQRPAEALRPNIIVFVADDLGWNDIGYHGSEVRTPTLDRLAETGVRLEQFYVYPSCSPTRAALLTGRNPSRFGIHGPIGGRSRQALPMDVATLPGRLRELGYTTAITGKWHLGLRPEVGPAKYGFDHTYGYLHGQVDPYTHHYKNGDPTWHRNDVLIEEEGHVTDLITREAVRFIEKNERRPFFLYVPYSVPHYPLNEPPEWTEPYEGRIDNACRRWYAASVTHMDDSIDRIVRTVDRLGLRSDTLIVFFSDNGGQESWSSKTQYDGRYPPHDNLGDNRPLRGWKGSLYEGGVRVPALVNWPSRLEAGVCPEVTTVLDWLPTFVAVAKERKIAGEPTAKEPDDALLEGKNIWPALAEGAGTGPRELYWHTGGQTALRHGDFKVIRSGGDRRQMFNLAEDPYEKVDLASEQPERLQDLLERLEAQRAKDPDAQDEG